MVLTAEKRNRDLVGKGGLGYALANWRDGRVVDGARLESV